MPAPGGYGREIPGIGRLALQPFEVARDAVCAHRWLTSPHARFWGMQDNTMADTIDYFRRIEDATTHAACIGMHDDRPAFLLEAYDPRAEPVGAHYPVAPGDAGLHVLVAPPTTPIHLFTWAIFALVVDAMFDDPSIERLVVEPDVDNAGIHTLNRRAGFEYHRQLEFDDKTAWLATCTRAGHAAAMAALAPEQARACARTESTA